MTWSFENNLNKLEKLGLSSAVSVIREIIFFIALKFL
jgi:hypothetical protein